ncbi:MAG: ABC transporter ATP-binding protein [Lachnospiraceae bacterium]|nr:ABC transporter ATP-binding protein [Lachnospiraceae bacterium]
MLVEFQNVSKRLGKFTLEDISFALPKGYIMGLIGPNGAGKTSLIHLMLGLYEPVEGQVRMAGKTFEDAKVDILNQIGTVLVEDIYDEALTLVQNGREYGRFYKEYSEESFLGYLKRFGLEEKRLYRKLSKGEKLKFQFAFALAHNPKLLILDEPTGNFDPDFREKFFQVLKEFIADGTKSVVLATHLTEDLDRLADYILYLEKGKAVFAGDIETLRDSYRLVVGERYKINLLRKERVIHVEEGNYGTKALVKHGPRYVYDESLTVTIPTIEELMYFMTKRGK